MGGGEFGRCVCVFFYLSSFWTVLWKTLPAEIALRAGCQLIVCDKSKNYDQKGGVRAQLTDSSPVRMGQVVVPSIVALLFDVAHQARFWNETKQSEIEMVLCSVGPGFF